MKKLDLVRRAVIQGSDRIGKVDVVKAPGWTELRGGN